MTVQLFPLLCGLATVCFCACISSRRQLFYVVVGFVVALLVSQWRPFSGRPLLLMNAEEIAIVCAAVAILMLRSQRWQGLALFAGGVMAAFWTVTLDRLGMQPFVAAVLVFSVAMAGSLMAIHLNSFISRLVLDEALMGVFAFSLVVGLVPSIVQGWQSASVLHGLDSNSGVFTDSATVVWLALSFSCCGVVWGWWRQHRLTQ